MQITVLGKSPAWQDAGGACSGYLVQEGDTRVLLDCGNGVFAKLRNHIDYLAVDAVVISHLHADHFFDLIPYSYALLFSPTRHDGVSPPVQKDGRPVLYAPFGAADVFERISRNFHNTPLIEFAFDLREYEPGDSLEVGPLQIDLAAVPHWVPTCAVGVTASSGRFVYGADCAPSDDLVEFARDTDLLMLESTLVFPEVNVPRGHLTPAEAGEHARRAGAQNLVITHITDELDQERARGEAEAAFGGSVRVACEGDVYTV